MSVVTDTTNHENVRGAEDGQPQGLPLQEVGWGLFRSNDSGRGYAKVSLRGNDGVCVYRALSRSLNSYV